MSLKFINILALWQQGISKAVKQHIPTVINLHKPINSMSFVQSILFSIRRKSLLIKISHMYSFNPSALKRKLICTSCPVFSRCKDPSLLHSTSSAGSHYCWLPPTVCCSHTSDKDNLTRLTCCCQQILRDPPLVAVEEKTFTFFICSKENAESWILRYDLHVAFLVISTDAEHLEVWSSACKCLSGREEAEEGSSLQFIPVSWLIPLT